jgi:hypothetical protein
MDQSEAGEALRELITQRWDEVAPAFLASKRVELEQALHSVMEPEAPPPVLREVCR